MTNLPKHLQDCIDTHEAKLKDFGIKPMYKIHEEQKENMAENPNHVLHAWVGSA